MTSAEKQMQELMRQIEKLEAENRRLNAEVERLTIQADVFKEGKPIELADRNAKEINEVLQKNIQQQENKPRMVEKGFEITGEDYAQNVRDFLQPFEDIGGNVYRSELNEIYNAPNQKALWEELQANYGYLDTIAYAYDSGTDSKQANEYTYRMLDTLENLYYSLSTRGFLS